MKLTNIQHVFFDLDHTLWDFDKNSAIAFAEIFEKRNLPIEIERFLTVYKDINVKYWERYRNNEVSKEFLRYGRLKDSFDLLELDIEESMLHLLAEDYIEYLPKNNHLLPGTINILNYLKPKYRLHIITNGFEEVQSKKMATSNILHYFQNITTSEEAGVKKPDPLIFEKALKKCEATAKNSVMIGDNYQADIIGAKNMGLQTIYFDYYQTSSYPDWKQIKTLKELTKFL